MYPQYMRGDSGGDGGGGMPGMMDVFTLQKRH